jgi:hypothetical protein
MEHDNKPHWTVKLERAESRTEKRRTRQKTYRLECILYRGEYLKAPLVKFKLLASIQSDRMKDAQARSLFWRTIIRELVALPVDLIDRETEEDLLRKIMRSVRYEKPIPARPIDADAERFRTRLRRTFSDLHIRPPDPASPEGPKLPLPERPSNWARRGLSRGLQRITHESELQATLNRLADEKM